jgi:hypothetical protein
MKVKLQNVRLSFADLFEAVQYEGSGPFKYRASFLMYPNSKNHKELIAAMKAVAKEEWKDKADAVLANADDDSKLRFIIDGNKKAYDGYAGMVAITATRDQAKGRPLILDKNKEELSSTSGKPYSGCYVNATVEIWPQNNKYGKTIRAGLLAIQFAKDGDAFGAGSATGSPDEFEDLSDVGDDDLVA